MWSHDSHMINNKHTNIQHPHISKSFAIHSSIEEELRGSHGNRSMTLSWTGGGAFNVRTHPLKGSTFTYLKSVHIIKVPTVIKIL